MKPGHKLLVLVVASATWFSSIGQQFTAEALLPAVSNPGFYRIALRPDLSVYSKPDFSDLRIVNGKGQFIPYLLTTQAPAVKNSRLLEFPILFRQTDTSITILEIEAGNQSVNGLSLNMANTSASRLVSVSGSNDRNQWYVVSEQLLLSGGESAPDGTFYQSVFFPYSRYRYYRLMIKNAGGDPMNILKTGVFQRMEEKDSSGWTRNEAMRFTIRDSIQRTWITASAGQSYLIEQLELEISSPRFYKRNYTVYILNSDNTRNPIESGTLDSDNQAILSLQPIKAERLLIEIENGDNQPMVIQNVFSLQRQRNITAYLEVADGYRIMTGDPDLLVPDFDIASFSNKIPPQIPTLSYSPIEILQSKTEGTGNEQLLIWMAIGTGILLLGALSYKLISDMKKNQV